MQYQHTLKEKIELYGTEPFGGNPVKITISPAHPDTGIIFETSKKNTIRVPAKLEYAEPKKSLIKFLALKNENIRIFMPEHLLAILFGYGVDNAIINLEKSPSRSSIILKYFGTARNTSVVPYLGRKLCDALDNNLAEQDKPRKILRLEEEINTEKIIFKPIKGDDIIIKAVTDYKLAKGKRIKQEKEMTLSPKSIKDISTSRAYCGVPLWAPKFLTRFIGYFLYLSYGLGYGCDESNLFYPCKSEIKWKAQELMDNEIACHTILDRIGDTFALFNGRVSGIHLTCKFASHKDAIETVKKYREKFYVESK